MKPRRPEAELLLLCARLETAPAQCERIRQIVAAGPDWTLVRTLAARHYLRPLLFRNLQASARDLVPLAVFAELWSQHQQLARRNQALAAELERILGMLDQRGIPALPYKGPVLATRTFGDLALREFGDLDVLLRPADIPAAQDALAALGYQPDYPLRPSMQAAFLRARNQYHLMLVQAPEGHLLELHWKTDARCPVESSHSQTWWDGLPTGRFGQLETRRFTDEELLLVLCLHGSKHAWARLAWLVDVAELLRQQPALDWDWMLERVEALKARRRLAVGLLVLQGALDVTLPRRAMEWLSGQEGATEIADGLLAGLFEPGPDANAWLRLRQELAMQDTLVQRLQHAMDVVFRPSLVEWSRWPLPGPLSFLYLPLRLAALAGKYARKLTSRG